jgi:predicted Zn-dependent protease
MSNDFSTTSLGPLSLIMSIATALLMIALTATQLAHSESFLSCNQRPHSLESVTSQRSSVVLTAGTTDQTSLIFAPASFTAGCGYSPAMTYASLSVSEKSFQGAAAYLSALAQLLTERTNRKQQATPLLRIVITPDAAPNAFIRRGSELHVTRGMLKHLETPNDAAFIVAHELAHLRLQHSHNASSHDEIEADSLAIKMMARVGVTPCNTPNVLARILAANARSEGISRRRIEALSESISSTCATKQKLS